jgi:hypothetical protein
VIDECAIGDRYRALAGELDERRRRLWAGAEALSHGRGGQAAVVRATGMSATTVAKGMREIESGETLGAGRVRRAAVLREQGHPVSHETVAKLLRRSGYSLQSNRKTKEGASHPDRDAQFGHINATAAAAINAGEPVISVDTKKKELVGDFKNGGRQWRPKGDPTLVRTKDFKDEELGKVNPYGVYDIGSDEGWVSVGIDSDTAEFAVAAIASWWAQLGKARYPDATTLTITADCGGSNGNRLRLWKVALGRLAEKTGLQISVCHFPPGTSKWNKIEHRLFSYIARNWRGQPLVSRQAVVSLIAATTSTAGLKVHAELDENDYERGIKISDAQLAAVNLAPDDFHGEWNYRIKPGT